jgi:hypothetical protein
LQEIVGRIVGPSPGVIDKVKEAIKDAQDRSTGQSK